MRHQEGVTLIEAIVSIVLLGIIATVASFFLASGLQGYLFSKRSSETAPKVQVALERINLELSNASDIGGTTSFNPNTSVTYQSAPLPGTRSIIFQNGNLLLSVNGASNVLLDNVANFTMSATTANLDGNSSNPNEVQSFNISFTTAGLPTVYNLGVMPRNFVHP